MTRSPILYAATFPLEQLAVKMPRNAEEGTDMNVSEWFDGAADLIEREGWAWMVGGHFEHERPGGNCASNAMTQVCPTRETATACRYVLARALCGDQYKWNAIYEWNDAPGRTKAEVIAMLRAVAATERAREATLLPVVRETEEAHG